MKKALLAGCAALLLATGAAHAAPTIPSEYQGNWCSPSKEEDNIYYSIQKREDCEDHWGWLKITGNSFEAWEEYCEPTKVVAEKSHAHAIRLTCEAFEEAQSITLQFSIVNKKLHIEEYKY
jgi:hypothetical protein